MKSKFLILFLSITLLTSCGQDSYQAPDLSSIENKLEKNKNLGNAAVTYDITKDPEEQVEDPRKKDEQNVYIDKNVNLKKTQQGGNLMQQPQQDTKKELTTVDELLIVDNLIGSGAEAVSGKTVSVHYTGKLTNGEVFDSSVERGQPFTFNLGAGQVIPGWDQGVVGMKVGGKRTLTIPADLAYGDRGAGSIPPGATLIFDIELLEVK